MMILLLSTVLAYEGCMRRDHPHDNPPIVITPLPSKSVDPGEIPISWDWRNVSGVNYVTSNLNQHIPRYCGSCWLHAGIATLNDRLKIARGARWPEVTLARQVLLNCGAKEAGSCAGGSDYGVYVFAYRYGIPDDSCQPYSAQEYACSAFRNCMNCDPAFGDDPQKCYAVQRYGRYFVSEYGRMRNPSVADLQAEIWKRGPVSCSVDASALEYANYRAGDIINVTLTSANKITWEPDHDVSVVGWDWRGEELYWIVRNSWGSYWGDQGWFYVQAGVNSMGIEDVCNWAVIDPDPRFEDWGPGDTQHVFASAAEPPLNASLAKSVIPHFYNHRRKRAVSPEDVHFSIPV